MKLFNIENNSISMNQKTVEYLLNERGSRTIDRIRYLIANLYNCNTFPNVELFSLMRNADDEHQELVMDIIGITQAEYGQACFMIINDLAPLIIEKYYE